MSVLSELTSKQLEEAANGDFSGLTDDQLHRLEAEASKGGQPAAPAPERKVIDEAHPAIRSMDRALIQNFTVHPSEKVAYLKKEYPDLEVKEDIQEPGRILVRGRGEQDFHVLSPSFSPISHPVNTLKDLPQTLLDNSYNIAAGPVIGGAAALGAAGGAAVTSPTGPGALLGAYGGAAAGGAAGGRVTEELRQQLAQGLGLSKEGDPAQVNAATAGGALAPLLFGAGSKVKGALPAAYGGLKNTVAPALGEFFSGAPRQAVATTAENLQLINSFKDPEKKLQFIEGLKKETEAAILGARNQTGKALEGTVNVADQLADATAISKTAALRPLATYRNAILQEASDPIRAAKLDSIDRLIAQHGLTEEGTLSPYQAWKKSQDLLNTAKNYKQYEPALGAGIHDKGLQNATKLAGQALQEEVNTATGGAFSDLNSKYSGVKKDMDFLDSYFNREEQQIGQKLGTVENDAQAPNYAKLQRIDKKYNTNIVDAAKVLHASKFFTNPSVLPISAKGVTSTSRTLLTQGLGTLAGYITGHPVAGQAAAGGLQVASGPAALKAYMGAAQLPGRAAGAIGNAAVSNIPGLANLLKGLPYPDYLKLAAKYGLLNASGLPDAALDKTYKAANAVGDIADGGWSMLQQYIGGQK